MLIRCGNEPVQRSGMAWRQVATALACIAMMLAGGVAHSAPGEVDGLQTSRKAAKALAKGQLEVAIELYTKALTDKRLRNDRRGIIHTDRGVVYARLNQPTQAIADFNRAAALFPEYAATYNNRGVFLVSLGALDEGIKDFNRAVTLAPGYVAAWNNRAAAQAKARRLVASVADYTRAVKLAPNLSEPLTGRAKVYLQQERPHTALRDLNRALSNDNRLASAYRVRAEVRMSLKQFEEAAEDLSRSIAFNPADVNAYLLRGRAYLKAKNFDAALKDFTKVVELSPRMAAAYRERANINILIDDFEQAELDLARAIELEPRNAVAFAYRALMYKKRDQAELGELEIAKALAISKDNALVLWAKGELEEARALTEDAAESYRKALDANPGLEMAELGLRRLGQDVPIASARLPGSSVGPWQVELKGSRYFAVNDNTPEIRIPLEMAGTGRPRLLEWDEKKDEFKGIALLRFSAGQVPDAANTATAFEYVAIVDVRRERLVAIEPHKHGNRTSAWTWAEGTVRVAAIDGLTSVHELRKVARPAAVARGTGGDRRRRRRFDSNGTPTWAPWADNTSRSRARSRRASRSRRRRRPKTLFDLILGN